MPVYRIYRLKDSVRQQFRWAPHTIGNTVAKLRDYEPVSESEGPTPYAVWRNLKETEHPLQVGDILESDTGELRVYKYVGFESAQWQIPEGKQIADPTQVGASETQRSEGMQ